MTLKGEVNEEEAGHGAVPGTAGKVGVTLGPGSNLGVEVEPRANTLHKAACKMYVPCPLMDPHQEEESPSRTLKLKQAPKETPKTTLQSPMSRMWRHG